MAEKNKNDAKNIEEMLKEIDREIQRYRQAIEDAKGALAEADSELDIALAEACEQENEPHPD